MKLLKVAFPVFLFVSAPVFAADQNSSTYLALGDSVAFGLNEALLPPFTTNLPTPSQFIGYPEALTVFQNLLQPKNPINEINASCPGETSGSFLDTSVPDFGCNSPHPLPPPLPPIPPFKTSIGLHTAYTGAQMDFAESQFKTNKNISLVTLSIGANDILLALPALEACGTNAGCVESVLTPVLQTYGANLTQILTRLRKSYHGRLVLLTYYSPAPALDSVAVALNGVMTQVAQAFSAQPMIIADGFDAFRLVSAPFGDDACKAGLLIRFPPSPYTTTPCDIHPSPLGRDLLAATIEAALRFQP